MKQNKVPRQRQQEKKTENSQRKEHKTNTFVAIQKRMTTN